MRDDIFRSMKNQMMPSDDCVNDLLAKIAALDASSEVTGEKSNVIQFEPRFKDTYKEIKTPKKISRRVWGTATAAVAAAVCLVSVFGSIGDSPEDIQAQVGNIIDNPEVVVQNDDKQLSEQPIAIVDNPKQDKEETSLVSENDKEDKNTDSKSDKIDKNDTAKSDNTGKTENSASGENINTANSKTDTQNDKTDTKEENHSATVTVEETKVAPSKASENELTWTKEILADSAVKEVTVEGSNYVVDSSVTSIATGSAIETVNLDVPETATTQADTVSGSVLKVANVSKDLAVAVDVTEYSGKLIYLNADYNPQTLGQFLSDAGIQNGTGFSSARYTGDRVGLSQTSAIKTNIKTIAVKYLFVSDAPRASGTNYNSGNEKIVFISNSNPTGTKISFGVSNNGFFKVILSNGNTYTFYIGEDNANAFIDAALQ